MEPLNRRASLKRLVRGLNGRERLDLLQELMAVLPGPQNSARLMSASLWPAECWFTRQAQRNGPSSHKHARVRMWFIFMLLRHGGLRLKEIFGLKAGDCHFEQGYLRLPDREVPFAFHIASLMAANWNNWHGRMASHPFLCDASQVRRSLGACAKTCGYETFLLSARALRRQRQLELEMGGLHPALSAFFLGKSNVPSPFTKETAYTIIRQFINQEDLMKTSARNVFRGKVTEITENGILVTVTLSTEQGLKVTSIITSTSRQSLKLDRGSAVTALVKAPWVTVLAESERATAGPENCYEGMIKSINQDSQACEMVIELPQGNQLCALYANGAAPSAAIKEGAKVLACFSPFAVILTVN